MGSNVEITLDGINLELGQDFFAEERLVLEQHADDLTKWQEASGTAGSTARSTAQPANTTGAREPHAMAGKALSPARVMDSYWCSRTKHETPEAVTCIPASFIEQARRAYPRGTRSLLVCWIACLLSASVWQKPRLKLSPTMAPAKLSDRTSVQKQSSDKSQIRSKHGNHKCSQSPQRRNNQHL